MERPFLVKSLSWVPASASGAGQFVDVLVSSDDDTTDTATPTGSSIFQGPQNLSGLPAGDADVGLPVSDQPFEIPHAYRVDQTGRTIKVVARFQAPAAAPPSGSVVMVIEEFDVAPPPIVVRPPVVPPPSPVPPGGPGPGPGGEAPPPPPPPSSFPPPSPRVPASYPDLVAMSLSNCIPRNLVGVRTGPGPGGAVCPDFALLAAAGAPVVSSLPASLASSGAQLAQRFTARVV